nr:MAG TPA: hypothetical protein [Caudoviricetes sp.]
MNTNSISSYIQVSLPSNHLEPNYGSYFCVR